jgi:Phage integrase family
VERSDTTGHGSFVQPCTPAGVPESGVPPALGGYRDVLGDEVPWITNLVRAPRSRRLPTVLSADEVRRLVAEMSGIPQLVARLLYGSGMRLLEGLRVRVKDLDFGAGELLVRNGKGDKDRTTMLPRSLGKALQEQLGTARAQHDRDVEAGFGAVWLPHALAVKYPNADRSWPWQWVFPAARRSIDPRSGTERRHHLGPDVIQRAVQRAASAAAIGKPVGPAHPAALLRHASTGLRPRHPDRSGVPRPLRREDDDDLHARARPRRERRAQPAGRDGGGIGSEVSRGGVGGALRGAGR